MKRSFNSIILITLITISMFNFKCKKEDSNDISKKHVWAAGFTDSTNYPLIYFSDDAGFSWDRKGEGEALLLNQDLNDIHTIDKDNVWVVSQQANIFHTADGGKTWSKATIPEPPANAGFLSVAVFENNIWVTGGPGIVYNSNDNGISWKRLESDMFGIANLQTVHPISNNQVDIAGQLTMDSDGGILLKTIDGGLSWDTISLPDNYNSLHSWIGITSSDNNNIVLYGGKSYYSYSIDGGQTWINDSTRIKGGTGGGGPDMNHLVMLSKDHWWCSMDYDNIGYTYNGGEEWTNQGPAPGPQGMWLMGIDYYNSDHAVIAGASSSSLNGKLIYTVDGGANWQLGLETKGWMNKVSFVRE